MASNIDATDRVYQDKDQIEDLITSSALKNAMLAITSPTTRTKLMEEHAFIRDALVMDPSGWLRIQHMLDVLVPARLALRVTDSDSPNLPLSVLAYIEAKSASVSAAAKCESLFPGLEEKVISVFDKRYKEGTHGEWKCSVHASL
jgi:hypothetical protein